MMRMRVGSGGGMGTVEEVSAGSERGVSGAEAEAAAKGAVLRRGVAGGRTDAGQRRNAARKRPRTASPLPRVRARPALRFPPRVTCSSGAEEARGKYGPSLRRTEGGRFEVLKPGRRMSGYCTRQNALRQAGGNMVAKRQKAGGPAEASS